MTTPRTAMCFKACLQSAGFNWVKESSFATLMQWMKENRKETVETVLGVAETKE